jgi:hypothetical protein
MTSRSIIMMRAARKRREERPEGDPEPEFAMRYCRRCDIEVAESPSRADCRVCGSPLEDSR